MRSPDCTGHIFDRNLRVDTMLVKKIDVICSQTLESSFRYSLNVPRLAVCSIATLSRYLVDIEAELRGDDDLIANRPECFSA